MPLTYLHGAEVIQVDDGPRPVRTVKTSVVGIIGTAPGADAAVFPLGLTLIPGSQSMLASLGLTGTLPKALERMYRYAAPLVAVMRIEDNANIDTLLSNAVGSAGTYTGVHAFLRCQSLLGVKPKIFLAPGLTSQRPGNAANPVVSALISVADKLKGMIYADGPSDSNAAALTWRNDINSRRVMPWVPMVKSWDTTTSTYIDQPVSPTIVGSRVWCDNNLGFWYSVSNKILSDVGGASRPIEFRMGDPDAEANFLNENHLNTVINHDAGWRSWGNRVCETDPLWVFESSVRVCDAIDESVIGAAMPWIDKPIRPAIVTSLLEGGNRYMRELTAEGAILGGKMWIEPDRNQPAVIQLGRLRFEYDREPASPLEHLIYGAHRNSQYHSLLIQDVLSEANRAQALAS